MADSSRVAKHLRSEEKTDCLRPHVHKQNQFNELESDRTFKAAVGNCRPQPWISRGFQLWNPAGSGEVVNVGADDPQNQTVAWRWAGTARFAAKVKKRAAKSSVGDAMRTSQMVCTDLVIEISFTGL
jgi:hypothetical protein